MNIESPGANFSASNMFRDLIPKREKGESTENGNSISEEEKNLNILADLSSHLFELLDKNDIDAVLLDICNITSEWRSLIIKKENHIVGGDINQFKLLQAFKTVLFEVERVITIKQEEEKKNQSWSGASQCMTTAEEKKNQGLISWGFSQFMATAAATANFSIKALNYGASCMLPESYQGSINTMTDQFSEYSTKIVEKTTFHDILMGVRGWKDFIAEPNLTEQQTNIRMHFLEQKVIEELEKPSKASTLSPQEELKQKEELKEYIKAVTAQHAAMEEETRKAMEMSAEANNLSPEAEASILTQGATILQKAVANGSNFLSAFTEALQTTVAASLKISGEAFSSSQEWVNQSAASLSQSSQGAISFVAQEAANQIGKIQKKMAEGGKSLKDQGLAAIEKIQASAEATQAHIIQATKNLIGNLRQGAIKKKNDYIASSFSPEAILGNPPPPFATLIQRTIFDSVPINIPVVKQAEAKITSDFQTNL